MIINSKTENVHERMQEITERLGADVVIEAVGSPVTYVMAVDESVSQDGWFVSATLKVKLLFKRNSLFRKNWIFVVPEMPCRQTSVQSSII